MSIEEAREQYKAAHKIVTQAEARTRACEEAVVQLQEAQRVFREARQVLWDAFVEGLEATV